MIETVKYCQRCIDRLSPALASTEQEKQFLNALTFVAGARGDYGPIIEDGHCEKCGQSFVVTYYRLPS